MKMKCGKKTVFEVKGRPFIAIAGETHNSSASSPKYMEAVWDKAVEIGLNTVLLPVSWELIEPEEGRFEFALVDKLLEQARKAKLHIIFLWFGSWKNAQCSYAPEWVKKDVKRFWRAEVRKGRKKGDSGKFLSYALHFPVLPLRRDKMGGCKGFCGSYATYKGG